MLMPILAIVLGLWVLVWSADKFVDGAVALAHIMGMSTLLIGIVIIGFGTSAPEMVVSAIAASQGNPGLALGNGYGSNIANIGLILGVTAILSPVVVKGSVIRKELPLLAGITLVSLLLIMNGLITRLDAFIMLLVFFAVMGWTIYQSVKNPEEVDLEEIDDDEAMTSKQAWFWLLLGLTLLLVSSRVLVWGAVEVATAFGVSDVVIGLTIVALGTSLPELAAALASLKKSENDLALGNVIGSNFFNTLAVVGIAGLIHPLEVESVVIWRDWPVMMGLTLAIFVMGYGYKGGFGRITRVEGGLLLMAYLGYMGYLFYTVALAAQSSLA